MDWSLHDHLTALQKGTLPDLLETQLDLASLNTQDVHTHLNELVDALSTDPNSITEQTTFDTLAAFLRLADSLSGPVLNKLVDALLSAFSSLLDLARLSENPQDHTPYRAFQSALERYAFLTQWLVSVGEKLEGVRGKEAGVGGAGKKQKPAAKKKPSKSQASSDEFSFPTLLPDILSVMVKALRTLKTERIWVTTAERDGFVSTCFLRPTSLLSESEVYMKQPEIKAGIFRVWCLAAKGHGQAFNAPTSQENGNKRKTGAKKRRASKNAPKHLLAQPLAVKLLRIDGDKLRHRFGEVFAVVLEGLEEGGLDV